MIENFPNVLKQINGEISEKMKQLIVKEYPKILFLGTGSCIPNKTRNTSGILVKLRYHFWLLILFKGYMISTIQMYKNLYATYQTEIIYSKYHIRKKLDILNWFISALNKESYWIPHDLISIVSLIY